MPGTFQSLAVVAIALLPGALYIWGFERIVGNWGVSLSDRLLRFIAVSALFQVLWAPVAVAL